MNDFLHCWNSKHFIFHILPPFIPFLLVFFFLLYNLCQCASVKVDQCVLSNTAFLSGWLVDVTMPTLWQAICSSEIVERVSFEP